MNKKYLYALWGGLFLICAGLGFVPEPQGAVALLLTAVSLCFFLPPAVLIYRGAKEKDRYTLQLVRNLSALSLSLTLVLLIGNFLSAFGSEALGNGLHTMLVILSTPMIASGHWALSLFLWACLLMAALKYLRRAKQKSDL